jgi:hypothetical protein
LQVQRRHLIAFGDSEYLVRLVRQVVIYETGSRCEVSGGCPFDLNERSWL